jgi:Ca-activated chloride channel family protein
LTNDLLQHGDLNRALSALQQRGSTSSDGTPALPGLAEPPPDAEMPQQLQPLQQLEATLQQAGLMRRTADGLRLTPKGARQIGAVALRNIFSLIRRGWRGHHTATRLGRPGPLTGETRAYEFGDAFDLHLGRTLANALLRQPRVPIRLHPQDFEVHCREPLTQSATVIMLDMSLSMQLFGRNRFTAAKKVALALAQLIGAHFPRDVLHIIGFGDTARQIQAHDLPYVTIGREHTNTQEGLRLARTLLGRQRTAQKHILLITDGRPTAVRLNGQLHLHTRGLQPVILEETYKEAKRCRDQEITLNTIMVADEEPLVQFVKRLTEISQGRAFYTTPERLGHYVIEDYMRRR